MADVFDAAGEKLGIATLSKGRSILGHMLAFGNESVLDSVQNRIREAASLRRKWFNPDQTNAVRLINAEGDGIPGLIVDAYDDILVMQVSNPGIEKLKSQIAEMLISEWNPKSLFEKSTSFMRRKEGLEEVRAHLYGDSCSETVVLENGLKFSVDVLEGQKTGLFLDQREMRSLIRSLSSGKKVLNCFAYTGGFSISALAGKASHVDSVEVSAKCAPRIEKNLALNGLSGHTFICDDVFDYLKTCDWSHDIVIVDPPAFVKKREDVPRAFRAYKDLNRHCLERMKPGSLLLTCSCSYHVDETLFQNILFRAASEAKRSVRILERHRQAHDHLISIFHPESSYLKSFVLAVS
ncbi:MAG: class I SAM-dependent rRNA methyltransferase [Parachlamydiales bacterium]|nr:class I SAM-dependent rRNA methyltransferase [Parachlamydiales bacterium]